MKFLTIGSKAALIHGGSGSSSLRISLFVRSLICLHLLFMESYLSSEEPLPPPKPVLKLSIDEAIRMALDKNYSIQIERLSPQIGEQVLRETKGVFDPVFGVSYRYNYDDTLPSLLSTQQEAYTSKSDRLEVGISGETLWGGSYDIGMETVNSRYSFTEPIFGDDYSSFAGITIRQPILRGFLNSISNSSVRIERNNLEISTEVFRQQIIDIVTEVMLAYYELNFLDHNLQIAIRNRDLALQLLNDNKTRAEAGSMAPLDVVQAESEYALRQDGVIQARQSRNEAGNRIKGLISDNFVSLIGLDVEIENVLEVEQQATINAVTDLPAALDNRPDYRQLSLELQNRRIELKRDRNQSLPSLDVVGAFGLLGRDATFSDSIDNLSGNDSQSYSIGLELSIPIANRSRDSRRMQSELRERRVELILRRLEQNILVTLENLSTRVEANWERVMAAKKAVNLARRSLEAEEKKLKAGTSNTFIVLRLQTDLANAEIREYSTIRDYMNSLAEYSRAIGITLDDNNIHIDS